MRKGQYTLVAYNATTRQDTHCLASLCRCTSTLQKSSKTFTSQLLYLDNVCLYDVSSVYGCDTYDTKRLVCVAQNKLTLFHTEQKENGSAMAEVLQVISPSAANQSILCFLDSFESSLLSVKLPWFLHLDFKGSHVSRTKLVEVFDLLSRITYS